MSGAHRKTYAALKRDLQPKAWWNGRRGHRRKHRHRSRARLQSARLPLRDLHAQHPGMHELPLSPVTPPPIPEFARQSQEKIDLLRMLGAEVYPVPAVAYENPANYNHQARDFAKGLPNAIWTDQFDNTANAEAHYRTTGPEIWEQTGGKVDAFICATGTGGTLAGIGRALKEKSDGKTQIWLADPPGSVLQSYISSGGRLTERSGGSITEGAS